MKRAGYLYNLVCDLDNLRLADKRARRGKKNQKGVIAYDRNSEQNLLNLQTSLLNRTYKTSPYSTFILKAEKERLVFKLPYIDRVLQHAVVQIVGPIFTKTYTADTYSCIKNRGVHKASYALRKALKDSEMQYVLKFDVRKYYPSVDHSVLKGLIRKKIKDPEMLWLLYGIIDSAPGLPIGNYLSQNFANLYLTPFDHWLKEKKCIKYCFRYMDDVVILGATKQELHALMKEILDYLNTVLKLEVKPNWRVYPIELGTDFGGYVHFRYHTRLRKRIKKSFAKMLMTRPRKQSIASYGGWLKHCDGKNLAKKLIRQQKQKARV